MSLIWTNCRKDYVNQNMLLIFWIGLHVRATSLSIVISHFNTEILNADICKDIIQYNIDSPINNCTEYKHIETYTPKLNIYICIFRQWQFIVWIYLTIRRDQTFLWGWNASSKLSIQFTLGQMSLQLEEASCVKRSPWIYPNLYGTNGHLKRSPFMSFPLKRPLPASTVTTEQLTDGSGHRLTTKAISVSQYICVARFYANAKRIRHYVISV